jgi:membrane-bound lytic murein transglycosylase D
MTRKMLWRGILLFLVSGCFPHAAQFGPPNPSKVTPPAGSESSLFTREELDKLFPADTMPIQAVSLSLPADLPPGEFLNQSLVPSISEECNDDFELEVFPKERPKGHTEFDIPIVINAKVEQFVQYFQTTMKSQFANWLARSERYIPLMKNLLKENGLPEDLVYLALIESGFNPYAYSRSKAMGPWQFIYRTGKRYGLKVNWWVDERRDPEKSTVAAAKYLKDLYDMFECWYLAAAGYNAGEGKIASAVKRYRTEDFWELSKYRYLKKETKDYVPQMIAAAVIAKEPEKYGFEGIEYQEPLCFDRVKVPEVTDLTLVAKACKVSLEELRDLNPELLRGCTPPEVPEYEIRIPCGKQELFYANFETLRPSDRTRFKTHIVKQGETLSRIARLYRVDLEPILEINKLKKTSLLSLGMHLLIPITVAEEPGTQVTARAPSNGTKPAASSEEGVYTIQKGDSLWSIANEMGVSIGSLSQWNNLQPDQKLIPGNKLKIRPQGEKVSSAKPFRPKEVHEVIYKVKEGDTLWSIAKKFDLTISEILTWNDLPEADRIRPTDQLRLKY